MKPVYDSERLASLSLRLLQHIRDEALYARAAHIVHYDFESFLICDYAQMLTRVSACLLRCQYQLAADALESYEYALAHEFGKNPRAPKDPTRFREWFELCLDDVEEVDQHNADGPEHEWPYQQPDWSGNSLPGGKS